MSEEKAVGCFFPSSGSSVDLFRADHVLEEKGSGSLNKQAFCDQNFYTELEQKIKRPTLWKDGKVEQSCEGSVQYSSLAAGRQQRSFYNLLRFLFIGFKLFSQR